MKRIARLIALLHLMHARAALWWAIRVRPEEVCIRRIAVWRLRVRATRSGSPWGYAQ